MLGSYLAGILDSKGIIYINYIEIILHSNDISLAYFIKKSIGYGIVVKDLNNNNIIYYRLYKIKGIEILLNLINNNLRSKSLYNDILQLILNNTEINIKEFNMYKNNNNINDY